MSEEKIDKAITGAVSNLNVENMNPKKDELNLIKKALTEESNVKSFLYRLLELVQKSKDKNNDKTKK